MTGAFVAEAGASAVPGTARSLAARITASLLLYGALLAAEPAAGVTLPAFVKVAVPFLALPLAWAWWRGELRGLGRLDRAFAWSIAVYLPFGVWGVLATRGADDYLSALAGSVATPAAAAFWVVATFLHVGAVDYFTKRVVQHEAGLRWGALGGFLAGLAAWLVGHVPEWMWLRDMDGELGAALFILATGIATGLAYARWRNVWGLMVGHLVVNVFLVVLAVT